MKPFFLEIFEYQHFMNQQVIEKAIEHSSKIPSKALDLLSHTLNAHHIWNHRINNESPKYSVWQSLPVGEMKFMDRTNFEMSCLIVENVDLSKKVSYVNSKGEKYTNSAQEVLYHLTNHSTYHRAQIATLFKEAGIQPVTSDYIFYKR